MDSNEARHSAAHYFLEGLVDLGVDYIFANLGTDHVSLIEELARWDSIGRPHPQVILCPHEVVAVHMAAGYALATVGFGFATWFPLSLLMYGLTGATDQISVVMRQSIIQLGTPDELRGRVSSVNQVFIQASSQIGAIESGVVATAFNSPVIAVVTGGLGCLVALLVIVRLIPQLWQHRTESVHA